MKKYFIFAAIATAGLFASCSSSDDVANEVPVNPIENQDDNIAIRIAVAQPTASVTRGTGTVGGVVNGTDAANNDGSTTGTPTANVWKGQTVKVYMFKSYDNATQTALTKLELAQFSKDNGVSYETIYENAELTTPVDAESGEALYLTPNEAPTAWADPNKPEHWVKYYPMTDRFTFWGYRVDNAKDPAAAGTSTFAAAAAAPAPTLNAGENLLSTKIWVDGTQDVLSGVTAAPTYAWVTDATSNAKSATQIAAVEDFKGRTGTSATGSITSAELDDYLAAKLYSASAARAEFQPELKFSHMMTRLTFDAYAGSADAGKYTETGGTTADKFDEGEDTYNGVYITGIKVRPVSVAATAANPAATYINPADGTFEIAAVNGGFTTEAGVHETQTPWIKWGTTDVAPEPLVLKKRPAAAEAGKELENSQLVDLITDADPANPNYDTNGSIRLFDTDETHRAAIGEAIIAPNATAYELEIDFCQKLVTIEDVDGVAKKTENILFNTVKTVVRAGAGDVFEVGKSYNFRIKVYGLERIEITTTLNPWEFGDNVDVDTDN